MLEGLKRENLFTIVFDQVMTDTALFADLILPATTFLEGYDFAKAYGPLNIELGRPVIDAVGESRSNADVFGELCTRFGFIEDDQATGELDLLVRVLGSLPGTIGDDLRNDKRPVPLFGEKPIQFVDVFPHTSDRKVDLFPEALDRSAPIGLYRYQPIPRPTVPLALISPASEQTISSTLGELPRGEIKLLMNPADAQTRGLADNDLVRIFNERGEVHCAVQVLHTIRPGTVSLPKGLWRRSTRNGATATALAPDTLTDLGAGACQRRARSGRVVAACVTTT